MGDAYPELRDESRDRREDDSQEEAALRYRAHRRAAEARGDRSIGRRLPAASLPGDEAFKLYDTFGLPLDFIEDMAASGSWPSTARLRRGDGRTAWEGAGEERLRRRRKPTTFAIAASRPIVFEPPEMLRGLHDHAVEDARVLAVFDDRKQQVAGACRPGNPA